MNKTLLILVSLILILILGSVIYTFYKESQPSAQAQINGQTFQLEIAKTDKDKQIGLSKYKIFPQDRGMLFAFDKADFYRFWMKDMKFPIDIIFIKDNKIVTIYQNLPINKLTLYSPTQASDKVIEINANLSKKYGFIPGDSVTFKNIK